MSQKQMRNTSAHEGKVYGRLTLLCRIPPDQLGGQVRWRCRCECGQEKIIAQRDMVKGYTKSCGCLKKERALLLGANSPAWRGGRVISTKGYVWRHERGHPNAMKTGYVLEHLLVMARILGRPVDTKHESIHHKNGIRADNRPENLELRIKSHGVGQDVNDLISYVVAMYPDKVRRAMALRDIGGG